MNPSLPDTSSPSLDVARFRTFDAFTTFEHELAGLAAKLQRWSSRIEEDESNLGRSSIELAKHETGSY